MTLLAPSVFPTALVTEARAKHWLSVWFIQLTQELHKPRPSAAEVTRCEEHIAMAALAVRALGGKYD